MVGLSSDAMKEMGFRKYSERNAIVAKFLIIEIYSISIPLFKENLQSSKIEFGSNSDRCTVMIGSDINNMVEELAGDRYEDTSSFTQNGKLKYFICICHEIPNKFKLKGGYRKKQDDGSIIAYDGFPSARVYKSDWVDKVLPTVITPVVFSVSSSLNFVPFKHLSSQLIGRASNGTVVYDLGRIIGRGKGYNSKQLTKREINASLRKASKIHEKLAPDEASQICAALQEEDYLKKFLFFFFFLELYINKTYVSVVSSCMPKGLLPSRRNLRRSLSELFNNYPAKKNSGGLKDKFIWCAFLCWPGLTDEDVRAFIQIKKSRDKISHGEQYKHDTLPIAEIERLSFKILKESR